MKKKAHRVSEKKVNYRNTFEQKIDKETEG
jgi:hypothetical protein